MRQFIFFSFILFFTFNASSQDYIFEKDGKTKTDQDVYQEGEQKYRNLLLIPYKPTMHLPDPAGDVELLMKSGKGYDEMLYHFRLGLDLSMGTKFKDAYLVYSFLRNNDDDSLEDLKRIYGSVNYNYKERPKEEKKTVKEGIKSLVKIERKEENSKRDIEYNTKRQEGELVSEKIDPNSRYMNVSITDPTLLPYLKSKYGADVLVFINQFEVKKEFPKGSDVAYGNYGREVKVHYSIYEPDGKQLYGNVETVHVEEKSDNLNEIINSSFPVVSTLVFDRLPNLNMNSDVLEREKEYQKKAEQQDILRND